MLGRSVLKGLLEGQVLAEGCLYVSDVGELVTSLSSPSHLHLSDEYVPGPFSVPAMRGSMVHKTDPGPAFIWLRL